MISGRAKVMGMARPRGCVRLNDGFSLLTLWRLWRRRSLLRNSTVPPAGTRTTRGVNAHAFWSISTLAGATADDASDRTPSGGVCSHTTAFRIPRSRPTSSSSASFSLPQTYWSMVTASFLRSSTVPANRTTPRMAAASVGTGVPRTRLPRARTSHGRTIDIRGSLYRIGRDGRQHGRGRDERPHHAAQRIVLGDAELHELDAQPTGGDGADQAVGDGDRLARAGRHGQGETAPRPEGHRRLHRAAVDGELPHHAVAFLCPQGEGDGKARGVPFVLAPVAVTAGVPLAPLQGEETMPAELAAERVDVGEAEQTFDDVLAVRAPKVRLAAARAGGRRAHETSLAHETPRPLILRRSPPCPACDGQMARGSWAGAGAGSSFRERRSAISKRARRAATRARIGSASRRSR